MNIYFNIRFLWANICVDEFILEFPNHSAELLTFLLFIIGFIKELADSV